jgi:hypothetical protein
MRVEVKFRKQGSTMNQELCLKITQSIFVLVYSDIQLVGGVKDMTTEET